MRIGSLLLAIWLVIGAVAAVQRHDFRHDLLNCSRAGTIALTVLAGPLNYFGVDPSTSCRVPQPSR
jgi:hypothetical protein